jgi:hypothetical protein
MTPDDLRQKVELKAVEMIKQKLAEGTITEERSQAIAQHVLDSLKPGMDFKELYKAIFKLDDMFGELAPVTLPIIREYEDTVVKQAQKAVQQLIAQGRYEEAEKLAHDSIAGNLNIVWQASSKG